MEFVDTHAHLNDAAFEDLNEVISSAEENYTTKIVCSSVDVLSSQKAIEIAHKFSNVWATVGIHPENLENFDEKMLFDIKILAKDEKVVAIGEIGLDYHFSIDTKNLQKEVFEKQINLANELNLPIVVHSRDAMGDTIEILQKNTPKHESVLHCYGGSVESVKILQKLGFSFSFGGVCTFKNAKTMVEVIEFLPIEKILLETDCPYLAPEPFRGTKNEPKNVKYIADKISKIKNISLEEVARITSQNAKRIFNI